MKLLIASIVWETKELPAVIAPCLTAKWVGCVNMLLDGTRTAARGGSGALV